MKIIKKHAIKILLVLTAVFLAVGIFVLSQKPSLEQKVIDKENNQQLIDAYLKKDNSNPIVNEEAQQVFERERPVDEDVLYSYRTPHGFEMISYSKKWTTEKLIELYEELLKNKHGEEMGLLYQVIVYGEADDYAIGTHSSEMKSLDLEIHFPALPSLSSITYYQDMGTISLYNGDEYTEISDIAHTLSHEYGHHFTFYYIFKDGKIRGSEYEEIRKFGAYAYDIKYEWWDNDDYENNHHWYLIEIAAEDYMQLMGSPTTKEVLYYKDVRQILHGSKYMAHMDSRNGQPQENLMIPLAEEIEGLYDYFHQFLGDDYESAPKLHEEKAININITKGSSSHQGSDGPLNFTHYKISWNDAYAGEDVIYTLICYDESDYYPYPIKTVKSGETMLAYIGTVSYETTTMIYWQYDNLDKGTKHFVVTALFPDGTMRVSEPVTHTFR